MKAKVFSEKSGMTSRTYTYLLGIAAVIVSVAGAYFSVTGLMQLFAGATVSVAIMAGALEFSKFVAVGFLYRYWGHIHIPLRAYLVFSVIVLMVVTSTGIYGYLSNAYQISSIQLRTELLAIESLEKENKRVQEQQAEVQGFIAKIPDRHLSKRIEMQQRYDSRVQELSYRSESIQREIDEKRQAILVTNAKVGPIVYLAQALNMSVDDVVQYLILLFVSVFDPLAVCLVFSLNMTIRLREKYRGDEYKIGAQSLTKPVDHRLRKSA